MSIPTVSAIRHASSQSPTHLPGVAGDPVSASVPPDPAAARDVTSITLDDLDLSLGPDPSSIPEQIGFLHEHGLNYGFPYITNTLQYLLEHIHVYTGLPWWASIASTAILVRALMVPLFIKSSDAIARQTAMTSVTAPLTERVNEARKKGDQMGMQIAMSELMATRKKAGISMRVQLQPMVLQGLVGVCGFKLLRKMTDIPIPGLREGGFGWLTDLTVPDPYGIMPVIMAASVHLLVRLGGESGGNVAPPPGFQKIMLYAMPGAIMLVMSWQPGALVVWFTATGAFGMAQALLLRNEKVRRWLKIAPLYKPTKEEATQAAANSPFAAMTGFGVQSTAKTSTTTAAPTGQRSAGRMYWQAPNVATRGPDGRVIDVKAARKVEEAAPKQNGFIADTIARGREIHTNWAAKTERKNAEGIEKAKKAAADAYEQRATQAGRRK